MSELTQEKIDELRANSQSELLPIERDMILVLNELERLRAAARWAPTHRHHVGGAVRLLAIARHALTAEQYAVYEAESGQVRVCPREHFFGESVEGGPRFVAIESEGNEAGE